MREYVNYLHRQLYVMDTYATPHNRMVNHTMAAIHSYLSTAFVAAVVAGIVGLLQPLQVTVHHILATHPTFSPVYSCVAAGPSRVCDSVGAHIPSTASTMCGLCEHVAGSTVWHVLHDAPFVRIVDACVPKPTRDVAAVQLVPCVAGVFH